MWYFLLLLMKNKNVWQLLYRSATYDGWDTKLGCHIESFFPRIFLPRIATCHLASCKKSFQTFLPTMPNVDIATVTSQNQPNLHREAENCHKMLQSLKGLWLISSEICTPTNSASALKLILGPFKGSLTHPRAFGTIQSHCLSIWCPSDLNWNMV